MAHVQCTQHLSNADLARSITPVPEGLHLDFIRASSYHGTSTSSSGQVIVAASNKIPVKARHVLLVGLHAGTITTPSQNPLQKPHRTHLATATTVCISNLLYLLFKSLLTILADEIHWVVAWPYYSAMQVEDIVDTGRTAMKLRDSLLGQGALSVKIVTLLDKAERRTCEIKPDYCCFQVMLTHGYFLLAGKCSEVLEYPDVLRCYILSLL